MKAQAAQTRILSLDAQSMARRRRSLVVILFTFMLLHQTDKLLIGPLTTPIMESFGINETQMGFVFTGAILIGGIFYPLWGYLFDRYARPRILALASLIWGATTWLSAIAPNFGAFVATRTSTGIDDASYPGAYSLVSDYFPPTRRGRILAALQLTAVIGGITATALATFARDTIGWRGVFYITGSLGLLWALVLFFGIKEIPRGQAEPEMAGRDLVATKQFSWGAVGKLLRKPTMIILFIQQFIYVFPFMAVNSWYFRYLEVERAFPPERVLMVVGVFALVVAGGTLAAGALGDWAFARNLRGRMWVAVGGMAVLTLFFTSALRVPAENFTLFFVLQTIGCFFWSFEWPNAVSTVQDIVEPEIRSTAHSIIGIAETIGSALAPLVAGLIATGTSLGNALLTITTTGWGIGLLLMVAVLIVLPGDIRSLRDLMTNRAQEQS